MSRRLLNIRTSTLFPLPPAPLPALPPYLLIGLHVDIGRGFVTDQDAGGAEDGACQTQQLSLTQREVSPVLGHVQVQPGTQQACEEGREEGENEVGLGNAGFKQGFLS